MGNLHEQEFEPFDADEHPIPDYKDDPNYAGLVDEEGNPDYIKRIEMRGFLEKLERQDATSFENKFDQTLGIKITTACLGAYLTWDETDPQTLKDQEETENLIAKPQTGDVLTTLIVDEGDWFDVTFFDTEGNVLPFEPWKDYDRLEFEKLINMAQDGWDLSCLITDTRLFGGDCSPCDPDTQWRIRWLYVDIFGRPDKDNIARHEQEVSDFMEQVCEDLTGEYPTDFDIISEAFVQADEHPAVRREIQEKLQVLAVDIAVDSADAFLYQGDQEKALDILQTYISMVEELREPGGPFASKDCLYCCFENLAQHLLGIELLSEHQSVIRIQLNASGLYHLASVILFDMKDYHQALEYCKEALSWNPADPYLYYIASDICLELDLVSQAEQYLDQAYPFIVTPDAMALWYLRKAICASERLDFKFAAALSQISLIFKDSEDALDLLRYVERNHPEAYGTIDIVQSYQLLEDADVPFGPSATACKILRQAIALCRDNNATSAAISYAKDLYGLTGDPKDKALLD